MSQHIQDNNESVFKLRIVNVDYYLSEPIIEFDDNYSQLRESQINRVPIIRIFGTTDRGLKACLHVHRVYPYLSIQLDESLSSGTTNLSKNSHFRKLVNELELNLMPSRVQTRNNKTKDLTTDQQIFNIEEIDAIPFYGYHESCHKFLRIYFYNPSIVKKASEQLLSGAIMDRTIQPFEAHIPYILQFFINNNLHGMNFIEAKRVRFRKTNQCIDNLNYSSVEPMSSCHIECDIDFEDIINRDIKCENKRNPGLEAIWAEEINRCKNSQELLNLNNVPSQERTNIPICESEIYHFERLYQGLSSLNIDFNDIQSSNSSQLSNTLDSKPIDFAEMIVQCIRDNDDSDEVDSDSSISNEMSQRLEDVITQSQKSRTKTQKNSKNLNSRQINRLSSDSDSDCTVIDEINSNSNELTIGLNNCVDAGTQTELKNNSEDSIDSFWGIMNSNNNNNDEEDFEEVLCDCDSDECCDACCDQNSDKCECDCEKCEFEKCKRIPQLDGAFDDESSDNYSPNYKDESEDSDFVVSKSKKKSPKKTGSKRAQKSKRSNATKKKKYTDRGSDSSDMEFTNDSNSFSISKPGPVSKKKLLSTAIDSSPSFSITSLDNDNGFEPSSSKKAKNNDRISKLFDKLKPNDSKRKRSSDSPIHMSFSESEASNKSEPESGLSFLTVAGLSYSSVKTSSRKPSKAKSKRTDFDENRSDRSVTPYLSHESDDEIVTPKTRPGPKSSKANEVSKPGPKSSKPKLGPKSSKTSSVSKPGPKSSKTLNTKPGPKSSKLKPEPKPKNPTPKASKNRSSISSESEIFSDNAITRSRRSSVRNVNYDDNEQKISTSFSSVRSDIKSKSTAKSKPTPKSKSVSGKTESNSAKSTPNKKSPIRSRHESYVSNDNEPNLEYHEFNDTYVQIDLNYYSSQSIQSIGFENLNVNKMPHYAADKYLSNYIENMDYWMAENLSIDLEMGKKRSTTRSKGALKDFYTLPHLNNDNNSTQKRAKAQNSNPRKLNQIARTISDASHFIGGTLGRRDAQINRRKSKTITPKPIVRKSLPKRGSSSAKFKSSNKKNVKSRNSSKPQRGVTSSTLFTTTSIPFYESDIVVVTELTGYKKKSHLKSLCEEFEIKTEKLADHYLTNYINHNISPFLFENIYYNDYSGYLSDEESVLAQDVIITMKQVIDIVASVDGCVNAVLNDVERELEPKPMIDIREEDYFEENIVAADESLWDYENYADDGVYEGLREIGLEDKDNGEAINEDSNEGIVANEEQNNITTSDERENQNNFEENDELEVENTEPECNVNSDKEQECGNEEVNESNDCENNNNFNNSSEGENNSQRDINSDREQENENEMESEEQNREEEVENFRESYEIRTQAASEEFSQSVHSDQYSNDNSNQYMEQNSPIYQNEANVPQMDYEEDVNQNSSSSSDSLQQNIPLNLSNLGITHVAMHPSSNEHEFKMQTTYQSANSQMFNSYNPTPSQPYQQISNIATVPTAIVSPIIPTVMAVHSHYSQPTAYTQQQNWSQNIQMNLNVMPINQLAYNMPNVDNNQTPLNPQQESEFDVNNYSYMPYYPSNQNIPQFDGIFDDDSFQSEGNQFNMNLKSDNNIEHLSQGSRSEEMVEIIVGNNGIRTDQMLGSHLVNKKDNRREESMGSLEKDSNERYCRSINGEVVKIQKSIPDALLQQIGREVLALDRLKTRIQNDEQYVEDVFNEEESKSFLKTSLTGEEKLNYLQSLCKDCNISINRLTFHNYNDSTLENYAIHEPQNIVSSFSTQFKLNKNIVCVENESNSSLLSLNNTSIENEVPETDSELNKTNDNSLNEIYSFYSNETLSPQLSQSTITSIRSNNRTIDDILNTNSFSGQHSTPLNNKKCKPFFDELETNEIQLSGLSQETSLQRQKRFEKLKFDDSMNCKERPKQLYDSIIEGPTPSNTFDFEISSASAGTEDNLSECENQFLTIMSVEVHVSTRANLKPDPDFDSIEVIFYSISIDKPSNSETPKYITGIIAVEPDLQSFRCTDYSPAITSKRTLIERSAYGPKDVKIEYANDEIVLLMKFVDIVKQWDPDIIVGFHIDTLSWGYVLQRANVLNMNVMTPLSRINDDKYCRNLESSANNACLLTGRITLNLWKIMRREVTLKMYSYENIHYHVLHERIPYYECSTLTQWYSDLNKHLNRRRVMEHYVTRVRGSLRLLHKLDFITRNSELARLFGIQFSEVFNRGTQFRVESIMLRFTKQFNYLAVSPNPRQVALMKAPECLPLILEPESKYYTDPVAVLDFQSLYPSMMIAYNYCYSTCLGKVDQLILPSNTFEFGCSHLEIQKNLLYKYKNDIHISPNGVVFLKEYIRRGILPKMLEEILSTRIMVKNAIKANNKKKTPNKALHRKLDARQLGLKLIANVTYGYCSANFSGRMPCVEIADSIVSKGRETLERAIELIQSEPKWGAKVIYGDTDSIFVLFTGCTKEEAFKRGQEIAEAVTAMNPKPVKLKFEKVYLPCVLETKKRYVGFAYESLEQTLPKFDAKGIETVRRDTCPAVAKMLEKSLKILFNTNDVNGVKMYLLRQFHKILDGRVSILNDFIFAREYRGKESYSNKSHVPSMEIAKKRIAIDVRNEPKIDERVPYVVVYGSPNEPLFKLVREPLDLIKDPSLRLNSTYYIERVIIPPLNRVFQLMGYDVMKWFREMPRKTSYNRFQYLLGQESKARTIPQYFNTTSCAVCNENSKGNDLCDNCGETPQDSVINIYDKNRDLHKKYSAILKVCKSCNGSNDNNHDCVSIDCPNLYRFHESKLELMNAKYLNNILKKF